MISISPYVIPGLKRTDMITMNRIISIIQCYFRVELEDLFEKSRLREAVTKRHICFYFIRKNTSASLKDIAKKFNQDHTTVMNGIVKIQGLIDIKEDETLQHVQSIERILNS